MFEIRTIEDIGLLRESCEIECKKAGGRDGQGAVPEAFWQTYSAMANTDGGVILLGVGEKEGIFELFNLPDTGRLRKDIFSTANNTSKVSVNLLCNHSIQDIQIEGRTILRVDIPRAKRSQRPVFLNGNPLGGNAYRRLHENDQKLSDDEVKRFLAEQVEDSRDSGILPTGFTMADLCRESVRAYRQTHQNLNPAHPWVALDDEAFLEQIGAWRRDRMTGEQGLTRAGMLMFGMHPVIQQAFPHYMLDYQERPEAKTELRWIDRVTLDGSWSGNLYDFYRKVYPKLTADLKTPFQLEGGERKQETPVHIALREALVNTLVHADYTGRASVLVVKRPDMFGFRNPGTMRIPVEVALRGGEADCRNRLLHQMFRYVGLGEQSGSGIPKIMEGWRKSHWRPPQLYEKLEPYDQTIMELRMLDLFPLGAVSLLREVFGARYDDLEYEGQVAMALALTEGTLTHGRLAQLTGKHPTDLSRILHRLVHDEQLLTSAGSGRGAVYHLNGLDLPHPDDVFGKAPSSPLNSPSSPLSGGSLSLNGPNSPHLAASSPLNGPSLSLSGAGNSPHLAPSSPHLAPSSPHLAPSSPHLAPSSPHLGIPRDVHGRLISPHLHRPIVDNIEYLSMDFRVQMEQLAEIPRNKRKVDRETMKRTILALCGSQYVTLDCIAVFVTRNAKSLQSQYLTPMVKREHVLNWAFPATPNDPRQAYIAAQTMPEDLEKGESE